MRVFVYEFCCAQTLRGGLARALRDEGRAMLAAVASDLRTVDGIDPVVLLGRGVQLDVDCSRLQCDREERRWFRQLATECDGTIVIAPESDGILLERCRWVEEAGGQLFGPNSDAIQLTGDKLAFAKHLQAHAIATPKTVELASLAGGIPRSFLPGVLKPRDGAGSQATYLVRRAEDVRTAVEAHPGVEFLLQPRVEGIAASVGILVGPEQCVPLLPAEQTLSADGRFHYRGGRAPLPRSLRARARELALRAVRSVAGLRGYIGVDLVLGEKGDYVIEINPRFTTSYVGVRELARTNLAAALLDVLAGRRVELSWDCDATVCWTAAGQCDVIATR